MDEFFQVFLDEFGPEIRATVPSDDQIKKYSGILPDALLEYWRTYGWAGFHDGLFWISNPDTLSPAAEAWLSHLRTGKENRYLTIARTAFGDYFYGTKKMGKPSPSPLITHRYLHHQQILT